MLLFFFKDFILHFKLWIVCCMFLVAGSRKWLVHLNSVPIETKRDLVPWNWSHRGFWAAWYGLDAGDWTQATSQHHSSPDMLLVSCIWWCFGITFLYTWGEGSRMKDDMILAGATCLWLESRFPLECHGFDSSGDWVYLSKKWCFFAFNQIAHSSVHTFLFL